MACSWLCREGVVIRRINKFLCCFKLSLGAKFVILYCTGAFVYQDGRVNCDYLNFKFDFICSLFNGNVHAFSLCMVIFAMSLNMTLSIIGIYSWLSSFTLKLISNNSREYLRLQIVESFFYLYFILSMFDYLNVITMQFILEQDLGVIFVNILIRSITGFYFLSVMYSFLLECDEKYRVRRRRHVKLQEEDRLKKLIESNIMINSSNSELSLS